MGWFQLYSLQSSYNSSYIKIKLPSLQQPTHVLAVTAGGNLGLKKGMVFDDILALHLDPDGY